MTKKRIFSFVVVIVLVFSLCTNVNATNVNSPVENEDAVQRQMTLFSMKADSIEIEVDISVSNIKIAYDFSGNKYTVVECTPTGYFIFHNASGVFVESSPSAPSPYCGVTNNLYYGGPTAYYEKVGSQYIHTVLNETIDTSMNDELAKSSAILNNNLMDIKCDDVVNFLEKGTISLNMAGARAATANTYVPYYSILYRLSSATQMGYYSAAPNGCCGYIGLGLLLLYADYTWNDGYINDSMYLDSTHAFTGSAFTEYLLDIGEDLGYIVPSTYAHTIRPINARYLSIVGMTATHYQYTALPSDSTITGHINNGRPVLLFGSLPNAQNTNSSVAHAVVVYGYSGSGTSLAYKVHYGWPSYSNVTLSAASVTNGSAYTFAP